ERDGNLYLVRSKYASKYAPEAEAPAGRARGRSGETALGHIPFWATPEDIPDWLKVRDKVSMTPEELFKLEQHLAKVNPPKNPIEMAATWLEKSIKELEGMPLRERQARIRKVRPIWNQLSKLAGTKPDRDCGQGAQAVDVPAGGDADAGPRQDGGQQ
ncbi:hypothetical protein ACQUZK_09005, partial [Streptococcus pyogenes]|uniref:hypothetical protein n=1 Tax=Streptococcus pyogenes TaxID=1314 RepID=UPI003DA0602B